MSKIVTFLPQQFIKNSIIMNIVPYIQQANCMFSSVVYCSQSKRYLINKNEKTPYIALDWHMYSIMRGWAKTLIQCAGTIRYERDLFKDRGSMGDKLVEEYYERIQNENKQNLYVISKQNIRAELKDYINEKYYTILNSKPQFEQLIQRQNSQIDLVKSFENISKTNYTPLLIQCGQKTFKNYFDNLIMKKQKGQDAQNSIQLMVLTQFYGNLHEECIGDQFDLNFQYFYELKWVSQKIKIELKNGQQAFLVFKIYLKRQM